MLLLEHTCTIRRNEAVGTNGRTQLTTVATGVPCLALPMSPAAAISNQYSIGQAFDVYFEPGEDVIEGDKLVYNGRNYVVKGLMSYETAFAGHTHAMCVQEAR